MKNCILFKENTLSYQKSYTERVLLQLMILFILLNCISPARLVYSNFFDSFTISDNDWSLIHKDTNYVQSVITCGSKNILLLDNKSTDFNLLLHKSFGLELHYQVTVQFKLWMLDNWINNSLLIYFDNEIILNDQYSCSSGATNICLNSQNDEAIIISLSVLHNRSSIQIVIFAQSGKWGISEFQLLLEECPTGCHSCDIKKCHAQVLFMQTFNSLLFLSVSNSEGWKYNSVTSTSLNNCHGKMNNLTIDLRYHRSQGSNFEKEIQLKDHWAISLKLKVMIFNSGLTTISIKIDDILVQYESYTQEWINYSHSNLKYDGFWYYVSIKHVDIFQYVHTKPIIKITILTTMNRVNASEASWFGIRDFQLFIHPNYVCIDHNLNPFDGCFSFNYDCVQGCKNCVKGICMGCLNGWQYININKGCIPICDDNILTSQEECDDGNQNPYDGCHNCKFSCPQDCDVCIFGKCLQRMNSYSLQKSSNECLPFNFVSNPKKRDQYKLPICQEQNFSNYYSSGIPFYLEKEYKQACSYNCHVCNLEICLQCKPNYILQNQLCINSFNDLDQNDEILNFRQLQDKHFVEIFYIKAFIQETPDYFKIQKFYQEQFDFRYYTHYEYHYPNLDCIDNCKNKAFNVCLECDIGYKLSMNHRGCIPLCGDGMVQNYEICQNQNYLQYNGCYKCQFSCQLECLSCSNGICQVCLDGWQLIDGTCQQVCGDELIATLSQEQCDDGNQIDGDGCYQCFFQCVLYCQFCISPQECLYCQEHFELTQNQCRPICGDLFKVEGLEECDDGNQISHDGCDFCQFQCEIYCKICVDGICIEYNSYEEPTTNDPEPIAQQIDNNCIKGCLLCQEEICQQCEKLLILEDGQCIKCGNGYKSEDEFCDDGNIFNNDGCSNKCVIEQGWDCNLSILQFSQCYKTAEPSLIFLNQSFDKQHISLTYKKKVKLNEFNSFFFDLTSIEIENVNLNQYNLSIQPVTAINFESAQDINYIIVITFLEKIQNRPKLIISLDTDLLDENEIPVPPSSADISLKLPQVLNLQQIEATAKMKVFGQSVMIGMVSCGAFLLLTGQFLQFLEILDVLQYQTNLKYINVDYPQNLYIYFKLSEFVTFTPILKKFKVVETFDLILTQQNLESYGKFYEYEINADILTNIYGQILLIILFIFWCFLLYFNKFVEKQNYYSSNFFQKVLKLRPKIFNYIVIKLYYFHRQISQVSKKTLRSEVIYLFHANSWDLIFKVFLYLHSNTLKDDRQKISTSIGIVFVIFLVIVLIEPFRRSKRIKNVKKQQLESILLLKKFIFILCLIQMQPQPLIQSLLLSFCQLIFIGVISFFQFIKSKFELSMILINELPIMIFTFINITFCSDFTNYFTPNTKIIIGFTQIGILLVGLFGPIIKFLRQLINYVYSYLKSSLSKQKQSKEQTLQCFQTIHL